MGRHVQPHRWADAAAGRLDDDQVAKLERHAARCPRCAEARKRVLGARETFDDMRAQECPRMHWDHIGARIYWVTSSERRAADRKPRHRPGSRGLVLAGLATTAAIAVLVIGIVSGWLGGHGNGAPAADTTASETPSPEAVQVASPIEVALADEPAAQLQGVVTFAQGEVTVNGAPLMFDEPIGVGERISTGDGMVAVQFGDRSGFTLTKKSSLLLRSFDERTIEFAVEGSALFDVSRRAADQRLSVVAGHRTVTVRGTAFRVESRDGELEVACSRGHVVLSDAKGEVDVLAGDSLRLGAGDPVLEARARRMRAQEIEEIEKDVSVAMLPAWTDAEALYATSGTLQLAAGPDSEVEVDGIARGRGSFLLRVMSGRHHVEAGGREPEWVDLGAGARQEALEKVPPVAPAARRAQVARALEKSERIQGCLRPLEKQGLLAGSFIVLDLGINRDGSLGHLNIVKSNMPLDVARCVRNRVDNVAFPAGPAATIRYRLSY